MGKIIAIGGGDFTSKEYEQRTGNVSKNIFNIEEEIIKFSNVSKPSFLFIPTASSDDVNYISKMEDRFKKQLNVNFTTLLLINEKPDFAVIKNKIESADIIYVGGGNTLKMMNLWRRLKVDELLIDAYNKDKVMCGVSAGSICWFAKGNSDSRKFKNSNASMIKVSGLGLIDALNCPHYDSEPERKPTLKKMMQKHRGVAIALDDNCAIQIHNDKYRIISSIDNANAYKVYWQNAQFNENVIAKENSFKNLNELLKRE